MRINAKIFKNKLDGINFCSHNNLIEQNFKNRLYKIGSAVSLYNQFLNQNIPNFRFEIGVEPELVQIFVQFLVQYIFGSKTKSRIIYGSINLSFAYY